MTDLTEKWKKGELERGWYYVLLFSNEEYITFIDGNWVVDDRLVGADIKEVLAPVPIYEEWKSVCDDCNSMQETIFSQDSIYCENENLLEEIEKIDEENTKLKELLKECGRQLEEVELCRYDVADVDQEDWFRISTEQAGIANKMKTQIDEVLK